MILRGIGLQRFGAYLGRTFLNGAATREFKGLLKGFLSVLRRRKNTQNRRT